MGLPAEASICLLFGLASLWLIRRGWTATRATTMQAAWCWAVAAICGIVGAEVLLASRPTDDATFAEPFRFAAAVLVFCPTMAILGGKRPQNGAWQLIVFTLWGILALPAFEIWMRGRGEAFAIDPVRSWFLVLLVIVGLGNHLPTRFGLGAALLSAGEVLLLWKQLPAGELLAWRPPVWLAMSFVVLSCWTIGRAARQAPRRPHAGEAIEFGAWSFVWRDFRDWFGTVWSVRMMDRVNASAVSDAWPVALGWDGFVRRAETASGVKNAPTVAGGTLRALMRRFVSAEWIDRRLAEVGESRGHRAVGSSEEP